MNDEKRYKVADFDTISPFDCPCGSTKRAFLDDIDKTASFHIVEIAKDSRKHYHNKMTEIYYVLEGDGVLELDDDEITLKKGTCILIKPGCKHRAVGKLKLINVPIPAFDEDDEWFD